MNKTRPKGYLKNPENILVEARQVIKENSLEKLPTKDKLAILGHSSLAAAIIKNYPGKYPGLRVALGEEVTDKPYGFWDIPQNVENELRSFMAEHNLIVVPSSGVLKRLKRSDLGAAIGSRYPGGSGAIREKFGETDIRKSAAYWSDFVNIKIEARKIIKELGRLPGKGELAKQGHSSFAASVVRLHGGFQNLRKLMGLEQEKVENDYWKDYRNIETRVAEFKKTEDFDHLPNQKILTELGYESLSSAISVNYPGGFKGYRESHNDYTPAQKLRKMENKTLSMVDIEKKIKEPIELYLRREYNTHSSMDLAKTLGVTDTTILGWLDNFGIGRRKGSDRRTFRLIKPSKEDLNRLYWEKGISKGNIGRTYNVGYDRVNVWFEEMGVKSREDNRIDLESLSDEALIQHGRGHYQGLTLTQMQQTYSGDYKYLLASGKFNILIEAGVIVSKQKRIGFWSSKENTLEVAKKIYAEHGRIPTQNELVKFGHASLSKAAAEHFGSLKELRKAVGEINSWGDIKYTVKRAKEFMKTHPEYKTLPSQNGLRAKGYIELSNAIMLHGGFVPFRKHLGEEPTQIPMGSWNKLEYTLEQTKKAMKEQGWNTLPATSVLNQHGYTGIVSAVSKYHGGMNVFRKILGEAPLKVKHGQWLSFDFTCTEAMNAMKKIGFDELPTQKILSKNGFSGLSAAISDYHGGFVKFRDALRNYIGIPSRVTSSESLLEGYVNE